MQSVRRTAIVAVAGLLSPWTASGLSWVSDVAAANAQIAVPPAEYRPPAAPTSATALAAPTAVARRVALAEPSATERAVLAVKNKNPLTGGRPNAGKRRALAIGFARPLPADAGTIVLSDLGWQALPDGSRAARIEINSPGAAALRVALALPNAHPDLTLKFAGNGPGAEVQGPYPANAVAEAAERDGRFWTPVLEGDTAIIELHAAAGATVDGVALVMGPLSHLVVAGESLRRIDPKRVEDIGSGGSCNVDLACVTPSAALTQTANSVGKLVYNDRAGATYLCTGTLLNDSTTSFVPYLFSSNLCFNDAYLASTLNVYWFFRAQVCGSTANPAFALQAGGAMLLARSDDFDWALLRLNRAPPAGVFFAAWRAWELPQFTVGTALHHPRGDLLKFSQGTSPGYHAFGDGSSFIQQQWTQGTTEAGSSGSALFTLLTFAGYYEVRGGLFGGDASCSNPTGIDYYSRLDNMLPVVRQYLTPDTEKRSGQTVVVEFYNRTLAHYFITADANEIDLLDTGALRGWERTGIRFLAYNTSAPGTSPVCRFYLRPGVGDSHFLSANPEECEGSARLHGTSWIYESGSVFYIPIPNPITGACEVGTRPIWRFFNIATTNHRYTPEVAIRDTLRNDPRWTAQGSGPDAVVMCSPLS